MRAAGNVLRKSRSAGENISASPIPESAIIKMDCGSCDMDERGDFMD
jgi:hypothetical protein